MEQAQCTGMMSWFSVDGGVHCPEDDPLSDVICLQLPLHHILYTPSQRRRKFPRLPVEFSFLNKATTVERLELHLARITIVL